MLVSFLKRENKNGSGFVWALRGESCNQNILYKKSIFNKKVILKKNIYLLEIFSKK